MGPVYFILAALVIVGAISGGGFLVWKKRATMFAGPEKRWQLYIRDDGSYEFRRLEVKDGFLIERKGTQVIRAWPWLNSLAVPFAGDGKKVPAGYIQIAYARDIVLDPFGQLTAEESPGKDANAVKDWVSRTFESQRYKRVQEEQKKSTFSGVQVYIQVAVIGVLLLGLAMRLFG